MGYFNNQKFLLLIVISGVWLFIAFFNRPDITFNNQSDGYAYYLPLRSYLYDNDIDFTNENQAFVNTYNTIAYDWQPKTKNGYRHYPYSIGPSVLWAPFIIMPQPFNLPFQSFHSPITKNAPEILAGTSKKDVIFLSIGSYFYGILSIFLTFIIIVTFFKGKKQPILLSSFIVLTIGLTTPFFYYFRYQPLMSHVLSAFCVSLFIFLWILQQYRIIWYRFLYLGLALGLAALIRWQDIIIGLLIVNDLIIEIIKNDRKNIANLLRCFVFFVAGFFCVFIIQMLFWQKLYGDWLIIPQGNNFFTFPPRHLFNFLFSFHHGLFTWSPITIFSITGLLFQSKIKSNTLSNRLFVLILLLIISLAIYVNGSIIDWHGSDSFGARRMVSLLPLLAIGLFYLFANCKNKIIYKILITAVVVLSCYNIIFAHLFWSGKIDHYSSIYPYQIINNVLF